RKILIVTDGMKLKGTVTDGDIRRWILKNGDLQSDVAFVMNTSPKFIREDERGKAEQMLREKMIEALPVVNSAGEITDIVFWNDSFEHKLNHYNKLDNVVVIMAGGKGTRLEPYTKIIPKPLIP